MDKSKVSAIILTVILLFAGAVLLAVCLQSKTPHNLDSTPLNATCDNGTSFDLGSDVWLHLCPQPNTLVVDIRYFFSGKPSIKGMPLGLSQWYQLLKKTDKIQNAIQTYETEMQRWP